MKELLLKISNTYINAPVEDFDEIVNDSLREMGEYDIQDKTIMIQCNNAPDFISKINDFILKSENENSNLQSRELFDKLYSNERARKDFSEIMNSLMRE